MQRRKFIGASFAFAASAPLRGWSAVLDAAALQVRFERLLHVLRQRSAGRFTRRDKLRVVPLDERVQQRRLGAVPHVSGRIDEWRRTPARRALPRHGLASLRWMDATTLRCLAHRPAVRSSAKQAGSRPAAGAAA
jgi:hypothetical protein